MIILRSVYVIMPAAVFLALVHTPPAEILGESSRILYFHVPVAWISVLSFIIAGFSSVIHLFFRKDNYIYPVTAYNTAYLGLIFSILTLISGSIWAKISWGSYWNWDPRETSMLILLMIYIAYFALSGSLEGRENSSKVTSSYLIFAALVMPFFIFIVPRIYPSLHPDTLVNAQRKVQLAFSMKITLIVSVVAFTLLHLYILNIMNRMKIIEKTLEDRI